MRIRMLWLFIVMSIGLGCKGVGIKNRPSLSILFDGSPIENASTFTIPAPSTTGDKVEIRVTISNLGESDLDITAINLTGNKAFSWDSTYTAGTNQPLVLRAGENLSNSWLHYQQSGVSDADHQGHAILTISSNDPKHPDYTIELLPPGDAPNIKVNDTAWTFASATVDSPEIHNFIITNTGKSTLIVKTVYLQNTSPDNEGFAIIEKPYDNQPVKALGENTEPNTAQMASVKVSYTPEGPTDRNTLIVTSNDPDNPTFSIPLYGKGKPGKLTLSYEDQLTGFIDFQDIINAGDSCTKRVILTNEGPGMVTLRTPKATGPDQNLVDQAYTVKWYTGGGTQAEKCGAYTPDPKGGEITSSQYKLSPGLTADIVVTYTAQGAKGVDAELVMPYSNPYDSKFSLHMAGGSAKGQIEIAPAFATHKLKFMVNKGDSQDRTIVIMNTGLGPLTIDSVKLTNTNQVTPPAFTLTTTVNNGTEIPGFGYLPLKINYKTNYELTFVSGQLDIIYDDPYTGKPVSEPLTLPLVGNSDLQGHKLPMADPGKALDYGEIHAGDTVILDGSTSKGGDFPIMTGSYAWFMTKKPQASKVFLNVQGVAQTSFVPDVAGDYEFRLVVISKDDATQIYYHSPEAVLDLTVLPAQ